MNHSTPRRNIRTRIAIVACSVVVMAGVSAFAGTTTLHAQNNALAAIDSLIASSRFRDASAALDRWNRDNAATVSAAERATAMLLRARLVQDADSARDMYLSLSLSYPSSPEAAVALLRLGQLAFAADDRTRAASYFQRIISDHPRSPIQPEAADWLARTRDGGSAPPASARSGASAPAASARGGVSGPPAPAPAPAPARDGGSAPPARTSVASAAAVDGAFALQVGAFRAANTAQTVVRQLEKAGFEARAVTVPANSLARVRVGRYATARAADETMRRLRAAGFDAVVVSDARTEKTIDR